MLPRSVMARRAGEVHEMGVQELEIGDVVLVKASHGVGLEDVVAELLQT